VLLGGALGSVVGKRAELLGGLVLIGLGCKILVKQQFLNGG
jgi:putative Mn2+ efflux pump MntP